MESGLDEEYNIYQEQGKGSADGRNCTDLENGVTREAGQSAVAAHRKHGQR